MLKLVSAFGPKRTSGGLMSYGTDLADMFHQVGVYSGSVLKGASRPTCRCCKRPNSSSSSTARPLRRSASPFLQACSPSPTRWSN